jgi:hypothetical protein
MKFRLDPETTRLAQQMRGQFLVPFPIDQDLSGLTTEAATCTSQLQQQVIAFCDAMKAVHATTTFPYALAFSNATHIQFQRFHIAAKIRAIKVDSSKSDGERTRDDDSGPYAYAQEQLKEFQQSEDGVCETIRSVSHFLVDATHSQTNADAAAELLYQGVIGAWAAFEVLARDGIMELLNLQPRLSEKLLTAPAKKHFELPKISIDELSAAEFNFASCMGTLIIGTRDFSDLRTIKAAFQSLGGTEADLTVLNEKELWDLNQDRHLIVHRRARIDKRYIESTGCRQAENERIKISPNKLEIYIQTAIRAALSITKILSALHRESDGLPVSS